MNKRTLANYQLTESYMSYILEALKKSEKERGKNQEEKSSSRTAIYPGYTKRDKSSNKKYLSIIITALVACIVVYLLTTYLTTGPERPAHSYLKSESLLQQQSAGSDKPDNQIGNASLISPQTAIQQEASTHADQEVIAFAKQKPDAGNLHPNYNDLPQQIKNSIPQFTIAGHTYSDQPEQRMLILNNTIAKEGQVTGNGLRLVEITWNGAVLRYNDTVFSVSASH